MSSLQASVEARRAAHPAEPACAVVGLQGPALIVCPWQGQSWVLPWSHLVAASFSEADGAETLELAYTGRTILITGHNLRGVRDDLAGFRLTFLRALPASYRSRLPADAPFIAQIEVRPADTPEIRESPS